MQVPILAKTPDMLELGYILINIPFSNKSLVLAQSSLEYQKYCHGQLCENIRLTFQENI